MVVQNTNNDNYGQQLPATIVFGMGETGYACARFLHHAGLEFVACDTRKDPPRGSMLQQELPDTKIHTGSLNVDMFARCKELILSPGVDPELPMLQVLRRRGLKIISEIDLFQRYCEAPVAAVTGTNGKSTVVSLLAAMAEEAGLDVAAGGNLGPPAISLLYPPRQFYILELSSFQLQLSTAVLPLRAACVLNISNDHTDRHDDIEDYAAVKSRIYENASIRIVNMDDNIVASMVTSDAWGFSLDRTPENENQFGVCYEGDVVWLVRGKEKLIQRQQLPLLGRHNTANYLAALAMGVAIDLPLAAMDSAMRSFRGLPHRMALIAEYDSVRWINDSKATNCGATVAAVRGLGGGGDIVLIAGGQAKDDDFSCLAEAVSGRVHSVILLGRDVRLLEAALTGLTQLSRADDMEHAVQLAAASVNPGGAVLFSPAGASFDMFRDYRDRGDAFTKAVQKHIGAAP